MIERLLSAAVTEQRRARRWSIFFKCLLAVYLAVLLVMSFPKDWSGGAMTKSHHTALVDIQGAIGIDPEATADSIITGLREAFESQKTKGVVLRINSPGGSPVHAGYIYDEMVRLRKKYPNIPLYAVITDICASGGYYIAAAADKIYADKASVVGSIGVLMDSFGFVGTMEKLGVERRLVTAGQHKGFMDPFSPIKELEREHLQKALQNIHEQFIASVRKGRGQRLKDSPDLYSGLVWTGEQGIELGLIDALGSSSHVAREIIGAEDIVDFTQREDYLSRFAGRLGATMARVLTAPPTIR
jgi:protease-4